MPSRDPVAPSSARRQRCSAPAVSPGEALPQLPTPCHPERRRSRSRRIFPFPFAPRSFRSARSRLIPQGQPSARVNSCLAKAGRAMLVPTGRRKIHASRRDSHWPSARSCLCLVGAAIVSARGLLPFSPISGEFVPKLPHVILSGGEAEVEGSFPSLLHRVRSAVPPHVSAAGRIPCPWHRVLCLAPCVFIPSRRACSAAAPAHAAARFSRCSPAFAA